jgi:hypothetical protein
MDKTDSTAHKGGLNQDEVMSVRQALLIGLASYGEIHRLQNVIAICGICGGPVPRDAKPIDPTGSPDTICDFAEALRAMEHAVPADGQG